MVEPNMKIFDANNFKVDNYVKELVQECVGGAELQQRKTQIQSFADQTSSALKKHVYANYMQFIETAKEISHLESEMYQLSHLLIEQRNILSTLREENTVEDAKGIDLDAQDDSMCYVTSTYVNVPVSPKLMAKNKGGRTKNLHFSLFFVRISQTNDKDELQNKKAITAIKESLVGLTDSLENKTFLHEGALIELDADNYRPICRVYFFLLSDLLIIGKVKHDKKLEYAAQYDATKIAVINIKDLDGVKNAINVITPDEVKIFQCISPTTKNEWIEKFEMALKFNQVKKKKATAPQPPSKSTLNNIRSQSESKMAISSTRASLASDATMSPTSTADVPNINYGPDWMILAQEEIQTLIAQRHFEEALALITKCEDYFAKDSTLFNAAEIIEKIRQLKNDLANVLLDELSNCQTRSLHAALISSRRPLKLLADMNKAREACGTLLRVCTSAIRASQRQARRNNMEISQLFFCDLAQVASEFLKAFRTQAACMSTLVVWCNYELQYFASQLVKHYLTKGSQLDVVATCVEGVREPCAKLSEIGLDLLYHMEGLLRTTLEQIIEESRFRLIDTIGRTDKVWQPYNLQTKSNLKTILRELEALGIDMKSQVTGDTWINLTQSTVNFCRHYLSVCESCALLAKIEALRPHIEVLLRDLFLAQYNIKPNPNMTVDLNFVAKNNSYLSEMILPVAISKYHNICGSRNDSLSELLMQLRGPPKPKPRSVYKTDVI